MGDIAAKAARPSAFMKSAAALASNICGSGHARAGSVGQRVGPRRRSCRMPRLRRNYPSSRRRYFSASQSRSSAFCSEVR